MCEGMTLKDIAAKRGITYNKIAAEMNISKPKVVKLFNHPSEIKLKELKRICEILNCDAHEILSLVIED